MSSNWIIYSEHTEKTTIYPPWSKVFKNRFLALKDWLPFIFTQWTRKSCNPTLNRVVSEARTRAKVVKNWRLWLSCVVKKFISCVCCKKCLKLLSVTLEFFIFPNFICRIFPYEFSKRFEKTTLLVLWWSWHNFKERIRNFVRVHQVRLLWFIFV